MNKLIAGQVTVFILFISLFVAAFFLGKAFTSVVAGDMQYCHQNSGQDGWTVNGDATGGFTYEGDCPNDSEKQECQSDWCENHQPAETPTPTPTPTPTEVPCVGRECPTASPTAEPTATPEETPLSCSGDQHPDAAGKNCVSFELGGPQSGGGAAGGQVLGASTMAKTGTFEENLYMAIMGVGGALTFKGLKNFKKAFKKA